MAHARILLLIHPRALLLNQMEILDNESCKSLIVFLDLDQRPLALFSCHQQVRLQCLLRPFAVSYLLANYKTNKYFLDFHRPVRSRRKVCSSEGHLKKNKKFLKYGCRLCFRDSQSNQFRTCQN